MPRKFYNGADMQSTRIVNLASPSSASDAANKSYVDGLIQGLNWKQAVRAATTTNGTLASAYANGSVIDGVTLATGDRILLKNQTTGADNGIYTVNASGAPTRATDMDGTGELAPNVTVYVSEGTVNADTAYTCTTNGAITIGTTSTAWAQVGGGTTYSAGNGLSLTGTTFAVVAGSGIIADGTSTRLDKSVAVGKYANTFGDGSTTSFTKAHGLGTADLTVDVWLLGSPNELIECDVTGDTTNLYLTFASAPASNAVRVVAHG